MENVAKDEQLKNKNFLPKAIATTWYFFSWHVYKPPKKMKANRLLSDASASPEDEDGKETKL